MNFYYTPNGFGWTIKSYLAEPPLGQSTVSVEHGYEGDTTIDEFVFEVIISSELQAASHIMTLIQFANSTGPITGGGYPKR